MCFLIFCSYQTYNLNRRSYGAFLNSDLRVEVVSISLHLVALLPDVVGKVVHGISGLNAPNVDHTLSEYGDNAFHEELSHVHLVAHLERIIVALKELKTAISKGLQGLLLLPLDVLNVLRLGSSLRDGVFLLLSQDVFTLVVKALDTSEVIVAATVTLDVDSHGLKHFELVTAAVDFKHLSVVLLEEASNWQHVFLRIWHAHVFGVVGIFEKAQVVIFLPFIKATVKIFSVPLSV